MGLSAESWEPNEHTRICGAHFISGYYLTPGIHQLFRLHNYVQDRRCVLL